MRTHVRGTLVGWLLLCALAFGVLAMHHLGTPAVGQSASGHSVTATSHSMPHDAGPPAPQDGDEQSLHLLHLCLAVLYGAVSAGALVALGRTVVRAIKPPLSWLSPPRTPARPPPRVGRAVLHTVCVLRV